MIESINEEGSANLNTDSLFNLLANQRRRYALSVLSKHQNPIALADLAEEVAIREEDTKITDISPEKVKNIYMMLYHAHIPKLEDENFVEYNQDRDTVIPKFDADRLQSLL
ncbi:hypothetical protein HTZ84_09610 [Haloterrigena sp. SYSU A558-1]|uniref:DUF7344 domain-containing protein n=1 Tax=Haloterrigena gelatinilytica TaxID=2741724 RepID=A0ABX2L8L3_9EURY|nr:hypothetical protein [Haloterrigena gelatinilytica]NUC72562.1 hypothetical protein [Haloterrigena gelatinilytica]